MKKYILTTICSALLAGSSATANAASCTPTPSCDSLGYTKTASQCSGMPSVKCPWDTAKMFCDEDPCTNVNQVIVPANASCSTYSPVCPSKCTAWTCKIGYVKDGNSCKVQNLDPIEPIGCGTGTRLFVCDGREYCCPTSLGYSSCADIKGGTYKCFIKNELESPL